MCKTTTYQTTPRIYEYDFFFSKYILMYFNQIGVVEILLIVNKNVFSLK